MEDDFEIDLNDVITDLCGQKPDAIHIWGVREDVIECTVKFQNIVSCLTIDFHDTKPRLSGQLDITPREWREGDISLEERLDEQWLIIRNNLRQIVWNLQDTSTLDINLLITSWTNDLQLNDDIEIKRRKYTIMNRELKLIERWLHTSELSELKSEVEEQKLRTKSLEETLGMD